MKAFPRDNHLTAIAIAYRNPEVALIADRVLPRVPVGRREFSYVKYPDAEMYGVPSTRTGEKDRVNRSEVAGEKVTDQVEINAQAIPLTTADISDAPPGVDPKARATERATSIITLAHERAVAQLVTDPTNYPATNRRDLAAGGNKTLDDADGDPFLELRSGLDACLVRPNVVEIGHTAWLKISTAPKLVERVLGGGSTVGYVTREKLAEALEVSEVIVGAGFVNVAKPGKTPVLTRLWGNQVLAFYRDSSVDTSGGVSFGITAQYGDRHVYTKTIEPGDMGLEGGLEVVAGELTRPLILAPRAAFLWTNAVSS